MDKRELIELIILGVSHILLICGFHNLYRFIVKSFNRFIEDCERNLSVTLKHLENKVAMCYEQLDCLQDNLSYSDERRGTENEN